MFGFVAENICGGSRVAMPGVDVSGAVLGRESGKGVRRRAGDWTGGFSALLAEDTVYL